MSFGMLALIAAIGLLGPLLALRNQWHLPVLLGELIAGVVFGRTGLDIVHSQNPTFTFLANIGFALVMFVAGSRVPIRDARLLKALRPGAARVIGVGVVAVPLGYLIAWAFHTGHPALYAVLMASSSAAIVLPIVNSLRLEGTPVLQLLPQVALADAACIVALPLVIDPAHADRAALGALAVIGASALLYLIVRHTVVSGIRRRAHRISEDRKFALELRINLMILFALSALAVTTHVSILLAGFCFGLVVSASGEPHRLAKQLFGLTDGFLGPLFFVWLGASLDVRELGQRPSFILLGAALGAGAVAAHAAMRVTGQPFALSGLAAAQLGVPVAAATVGSQLHLLAPGESAALILGALITIGAAAACGKAGPPAPCCRRTRRKSLSPTCRAADLSPGRRSSTR